MSSKILKRQNKNKNKKKKTFNKNRKYKKEKYKEEQSFDIEELSEKSESIGDEEKNSLIDKFENMWTYQTDDEQDEIEKYNKKPINEKIPCSINLKKKNIT